MNETVVFEGKFIRCLNVDGWEYVERNNCTGVAVVIPITSNNEIILIQQYRVPVKADVIELPAGLVNDDAGVSDESAETAGLRELVEETGYSAGKMERLTTGPTSAGLSTEIKTLFLATDLKKISSGGGDETENIQVHTIPLDSIDKWLNDRSREGLLIDSKIYAGLYFITRR